MNETPAGLAGDGADRAPAIATSPLVSGAAPPAATASESGAALERGW
jgi:hypothetical protein